MPAAADDEPPVDEQRQGIQRHEPVSRRRCASSTRRLRLTDCRRRHQACTAGEATLFVSTPEGREAKIIQVERRAEQRQLSSRWPRTRRTPSRRFRSKVGVDEWAHRGRRSGDRLPDGQVGEIWLHGNNLGAGYWGKEEESAQTFAISQVVSRNRTRRALRTRAMGSTATTARTTTPPLYSGPDQGLVIIDGRTTTRRTGVHAQESTRAADRLRGRILRPANELRRGIQNPTPD